MRHDPRDNEAQVADGMSDVMAGSTIAFMAVTVFMVVAFLALLLVLNVKREESGLVERLQQQMQEQQEQLAQARAEATTARAQATRARAQAAGGIHVSAGYTFKVSGEDSTAYLTELDDGSCRKPIKVEYVCRRPDSRDFSEFVCDENGKYRSRGVVPR